MSCHVKDSVGRDYYSLTWFQRTNTNQTFSQGLSSYFKFFLAFEISFSFKCFFPGLWNFFFFREKKLTQDCSVTTSRNTLIIIRWHIRRESSILKATRRRKRLRQHPLPREEIVGKGRRAVEKGREGKKRRLSKAANERTIGRRGDFREHIFSPRVSSHIWERPPRLYI